MSIYGRTGQWWDTERVLDPAASFQLTKEIFVEAERKWPDLMEPWSNWVGEADDLKQQQDIMRSGLNLTFDIREPVPEPHDLRKNIDDL